MNQARQPNLPDGTSAVAATQASGGDPAHVGERKPRSRDDSSRSEWSCGHRGSTGGGGGEPESPARCRNKAAVVVDSLGVYQTRSIFSFSRRRSSGYFSFDSDSLPSSPFSPRPLTAEKATQTPSPSAQVMNHALLRTTDRHGGGAETQRHHESSRSLSSTRRGRAARDMQAEAVGQELRRIGDDFNRLFLLRGAPAAGRQRQRPAPDPVLHIHQEPSVLLCVGLLLLVVGRIIYLHVNLNGQDHAQV